MITELEIADWRREIFALYQDVRAAIGASSGRESWALWRDQRAKLFTAHPASPTYNNGAAAPVLFDYDPRWCFAAKIQPFDRPPPSVPMNTGSDGTTWIKPLGMTDGLAPQLHQELTLYWISGYGGGLFLPFRDSGTHVYGGGRYLLDTIKGADLGCNAHGQLWLDFNFAYNPSCAYSDAWVCPLPAAENCLKLAVPAGEKSPTQGKTP